MTEQIGFIGLGNMGYGMASNLLNAGYEVLAFDIDENKLNAVLTLGAKKAHSIKEIGETTETILICLPHPDISKEVIFDQNNLLSAKNSIQTIIDTSTLTPEDVIDISERLKEQKVNFLCAPMLGGKQAALKANIHFLVEGENDVFEQYKKVLQAMGSRVDFMGKPPSATLTKLAYNMCRYSNLATAVEVTRFIRSYITDTHSTYDILTEGSLDNFGQVWKEDIKETMLNGNSYIPSNIPEKDLTLMIKLTQNQKLSDKLLQTIKDIYHSLKR